MPLWHCRPGVRTQAPGLQLKPVLRPRTACEGSKNIMRRGAVQLPVSCSPGSGAYSDVRSPLCVNCCLALPHAALEVIALRCILSRPGLCPRRNTSDRWIPAPALKLAGESVLDRVAILAGRSRAGNLARLDRRDVAAAARLVETVDCRWAAGSGGACGLLHRWGSQKAGRRGLGLLPDHARSGGGTCIPGRVSVLVEPRISENRGDWPTRSLVGG
jgi:hypothetical protein